MNNIPDLPSLSSSEVPVDLRRVVDQLRNLLRELKAQGGIVTRQELDEALKALP